MNDIKIVKTRTGNAVTVKLEGRMSEASDYAAIGLDAAVASVEFDFTGVTLINSKGIQLWKNYMTALPPSLVIVYVNCTLKVVNQLNLFPSFQGNKKVEIKTFFAPYFCEACDSQTQICLETAKHFPDPRTASAPETNCQTCGKPMDFDANAQKYFMFLRRSA